MSVEGAAISLLLPAACGCLWELINLWQGNAPISQTEGIPHRAVGSLCFASPLSFFEGIGFQYNFPPVRLL